MAESNDDGCREEQQDEMLALESMFSLSDSDCLKVNTEDFQILTQPQFHESANGGVSVTENSGASITETDGVGVTHCVPPPSALLVSGDFLAMVQIPPTIIYKGEVLTCKHLPPIILGFQLPTDYPARSPPTYRLTCNWLTAAQLNKLCDKLDELWEENQGSPILYNWIYFLQHDSLDHLGINDQLEILPSFNRSISSNQELNNYTKIISELNPETVLDTLHQYERAQSQLEFERSVWECSICFSNKTGDLCFAFSACSHIYCKDCISQNFTVLINEGEVKRLCCPTENCSAEAHQSEIKSLVDEDLYNKYERLLLQNTLDTMLDIGYCPRPSCNTPVLLEKDSTLATCTACTFSFCKMCKMGYHGIQPCNVQKGDLMKKLAEASSDDMDELKERYGQQFVKVLARERASYSWMEKNCDRCPSCNVQITKGDGCNKMTCAKCRIYFCWICKSILPRFDPYTHYRSGSNCSLFPGQEDMEVAFLDAD